MSDDATGAELLNNVACGYLLCDPAGRIRKANRTLLEWLGMAAESAAPRRFQDLLNVAGKVFFETHFAPLLRMQGFFNEVALDLVDRGGRLVPVLVNATELLDSAGKPSGIAMVLFKAADRRRYEHELLLARREAEAAGAELRLLNQELERRVEQAVQERMKSEAQLRQSQKMEAIGQLTGNMAHDFNNLLSIIGGAAAILKRRGLSEARYEELTQTIIDTVQRGAALTGSLLAFARKQVLAPQLFDACKRARELRNTIGMLTGSRMEMEIICRGPNLVVEADPSQFDTALLNLIVNARDAMAGVGRVTMTIATCDGVPAIRSHAAVPGPYVFITLADRGSGIPPELIERIFEPYFTTKGEGSGTGLGLSQVFGFASQSGGHVAVESVVGQGSSFTIYLPAAVADEGVGDPPTEDSR